MQLNIFSDNNEALNLLDWHQIRSDLSILSHFEHTKNIFDSSPTSKSLEEISNLHNKLDEYLTHFDEFSYSFNTYARLLPPDNIGGQLMLELKKGKMFDAHELNFFALLFESFVKLSNDLKESKYSRYNIDDINQTSFIRRTFLNPVRDFILPSGQICYDNHPALRKLNLELGSLELDLRQSIQKLARDRQFKDLLQMENFDIINDRYVLAIKSDSYSSSLGAIVARSQSGMTLFIEPFSLREKSSQRIKILSEIESVILHLTINMSKSLYEFRDSFSHFLDYLHDLDLLNTKALYSLKNGLTRPIMTNKFHFEFRGLYHPLLKNPVKNNLTLTPDKEGLIISGPNTGGKTVVLKAVCLSIIFTHMGLFVPASFAEINPVSGLFYFSNDHQDLKVGLSSFASESLYYLKLLTELAPNNLIVIDEIFNSTSSEEASSLALALFEEIKKRSNSKILVSTHHQMLKTLMHSRNDYLSAHVGFDFDQNLPTYKLITGEPGSSLAFKIFEKLSNDYHISNHISEKAAQYLDKKQLTYESLLQELSAKKIELDKLLGQNREYNLELKNQKKSMEGILFLEKEKLFSEYKQKLQKIFNQAEILLADVREDKIKSKRSLDQLIARVNSELHQHGSEKMIVDDTLSTYNHLPIIHFENIKLQMTLFSLNLKKNVLVTGLNQRKKEVQIKNGQLTLWVNASSLRQTQGSKEYLQKVYVHIDKKTVGKIEYDCRGMRLEEFSKVCEQAISELINGDIPFVTIIHGHGDGVLKKWLRLELSKNYRELKWENIEGNDGCTKISI